MKKTFESMLEHPFATMLLVSAATSGVARIIAAAKGSDIQPTVNVVCGGSGKSEGRK